MKTIKEKIKLLSVAFFLISIPPFFALFIAYTV